MKNIIILFIFSAFIASCTLKIPTLGDTGYYALDTPSNNWQVGEVVAIYIGRNTPYKVTSIYDPNISEMELSEAPLNISEEVIRQISADVEAEVNTKIAAEGRASGEGYRKSIMTLANVKTIQVPHTEIIRALREGALKPGTVECEYLNDLESKVLVDVLEGLLVADPVFEVVDSTGVTVDIDAEYKSILEGSLGIDLQLQENKSLVGKGLVVGYKKDPNLLVTAKKSCKE